MKARLAQMLRSLASSYRKRAEVIEPDPQERVKWLKLVDKAEALERKAKEWEK